MISKIFSTDCMLSWLIFSFSQNLELLVILKVDSVKG